MNPNNYGTREACQRLADAGIVLETDQQWYILKNGDCYLSGESVPMIEIVKEYPAPSMAEVWRELPEAVMKRNNQYLLLIEKIKRRNDETVSCAAYQDGAGYCQHFNANTNPADALIDLLIWVEKEGEDDSEIQHRDKC